MSSAILKMNDFEFYLKMHHRLDPDDIEVSDVRGYWEIKKPCGGAGKCFEPIHGCLFNEGPTHHAVSYTDPEERDPKGRWLSPYRTWRAARAAANEKRKEKEGDRQ